MKYKSIKRLTKYNSYKQSTGYARRIKRKNEHP